jgi:3-methyladenine DNA glycosylase Tag
MAFVINEHLLRCFFSFLCRVFLQLQQEHGSFDAFVWSFVPQGQPIVNHWTQLSQVPTK